LLAADARDRRGELIRIERGIFLVEVAGLQQVLGEQLLDMGRSIERGGQLPELCGDGTDEDIGQAATGVFRGRGGGDFGGKRLFMQPFDDRTEQGFLGFEVMVERLPRQAGGLRRRLDRRTPETLPAEHQHSGIENAGTRAHLTILTKLDEVSNNEIANRDQGRDGRAEVTDRTTLYVCRQPNGPLPSGPVDLMFALKNRPIEGAFRNASSVSCGRSQYWW
jgi:hypothetical protein